MEKLEKPIEIPSHLNEEQRLIANPLMLFSSNTVSGPPGTGKTISITTLINQLIAHTTFDVLVFSERNGAIDAICAALEKDCFSENNELINEELWKMVYTCGSKAAGESTKRFHINQKLLDHPELKRLDKKLGACTLVLKRARDAAKNTWLPIFAKLGGVEAHKADTRLKEILDEDFVIKDNREYNKILDELENVEAFKVVDFDKLRTRRSNWQRGLVALLEKWRSKHPLPPKNELWRALHNDLTSTSVALSDIFEMLADALLGDDSDLRRKMMAKPADMNLETRVVTNRITETECKKLHRTRDELFEELSEGSLFAEARVKMSTIGSLHKMGEGKSDMVVIGDECGTIQSYGRCNTFSIFLL